MKALITQTGQYGPFTSITQTADRWVCDGAEFQFSVIGDATIGEYVAPPPPPKTREELKAEREAAVAAIKVTTQAGHTFDGDEVSQGRMSRAIIALSTGLAPSVNWVLADNSVIQATAAELTEALVLAGQAQAQIWVIE
jgi:predicted carbohydrate-binding protein with CBM5 and CBM33 domain